MLWREGRIEKAVGKKGQGVEEDKEPGKRDQGHKTQLDGIALEWLFR